MERSLFERFANRLEVPVIPRAILRLTLIELDHLLCNHRSDTDESGLEICTRITRRLLLRLPLIDDYTNVYSVTFDLILKCLAGMFRYKNQTALVLDDPLYLRCLVGALNEPQFMIIRTQALRVLGVIVINCGYKCHKALVNADIVRQLSYFVATRLLNDDTTSVVNAIAVACNLIRGPYKPPITVVREFLVLFTMYGLEGDHFLESVCRGITSLIDDETSDEIVFEVANPRTLRLIVGSVSPTGNPTMVNAALRLLATLTEFTEVVRMRLNTWDVLLSHLNDVLMSPTTTPTNITDICSIISSTARAKNDILRSVLNSAVLRTITSKFPCDSSSVELRRQFVGVLLDLIAYCEPENYIVEKRLYDPLYTYFMTIDRGDFCPWFVKKAYDTMPALLRVVKQRKHITNYALLVFKHREIIVEHFGIGVEFNNPQSQLSKLPIELLEFFVLPYLGTMPPLWGAFKMRPCEGLLRPELRRVTTSPAVRRRPTAAIDDSSSSSSDDERNWRRTQKSGMVFRWS